uniref:Uncharacterized protein n=1 Tax=Panstrongylus lignarius TaxID=156445 RepID=A0A224XRN4_9HEMI
MIIVADNSTFIIRCLVIIGCLTFLGPCFTTSLSTGSTPKLCAGGPSIIMLIQSICMALSGLGIPKSVAKAIKDKAAILVLSWNLTKFLIL